MPTMTRHDVANTTRHTSGGTGRGIDEKKDSHTSNRFEIETAKNLRDLFNKIVKEVSEKVSRIVARPPSESTTWDLRGPSLLFLD